MKTRKTSRPASPPSVPQQAGLRRMERVGATKATAKSLTSRSKNKYVFRLFVAGATDKSRQAVLRIRQLCEAELKGGCDLEVIDIYQQPGLARDNQIVVTPTLIIEFPPPLRRFIGNLANITGLVVELDLPTKGKIEL